MADNRYIRELPHMFEMDVHRMSIMNLIFTQNGIRTLEDILFKDDEGKDLQIPHAEQLQRRAFCEDLRLNAGRMATVILVTRFQHWIGRFIKQANITVTKKRNDPSMLVLQLQALNGALGDGPIPVFFFDELEEVRNSVIHADSQGAWVTPLGNRRKVADQYRNDLGEVQISNDQLNDAAQKMIEQVKWYEDKLSAQGTP